MTSHIILAIKSRSLNVKSDRKFRSLPGANFLLGILITSAVITYPKFKTNL